MFDLSARCSLPAIMGRNGPKAQVRFQVPTKSFIITDPGQSKTVPDILVPVAAPRALLSCGMFTASVQEHLLCSDHTVHVTAQARFCG